MAGVLCVIDGCGKKRHVSRGWCSAHYWRFKTYGDPLAAVEARIPAAADGLCTIEDCTRVNSAAGLCQWHYHRRDAAKVCTIPGCSAPLRAKGWCFTHYMRWWRAGDPGTAGLLRVWKYAGAACRVENCERTATLNSMCERHHMRLVGGPKRRARVASVPHFAITARDSARLLSSPCLACGSRANISADHIIPISRGGLHGIGNLIPLCRLCNSSKRDLTWMEWRTSGRPRAAVLCSR